MCSNHCLDLVNIACERGETRLFEGCNAQIRSGECWQIQGHNGIGKTSLLRIIAGLSTAAEGQVLWDNIPIEAQRENYHANLFYLGHHTAIKPELTAWENLRFFQKIYALPLDDDALFNALAQVSLLEYEDLPCYSLSAGQQRRVALAKLYLTQAKLWILDEPFTAIDKQGVRNLINHIVQHNQQDGITLLTSHQTVEIQQILALSLDNFKV